MRCAERKRNFEKKRKKEEKMGTRPIAISRVVQVFSDRQTD